MPAFLTLDSVSARTPDGRDLFTGLSLSVGFERIGFVGRNGCGKSTLLRLIAGAEPPATGGILRSGTTGTLAQDWPGDWPVARILGVTDRIATLRRIVAGDGDDADFADADWTLEARVEAALAETGLAGVSPDRTAASLSGGERVRVGLARLLIDRPDLLLLDEPTNNLDAGGRADIAALVRGWKGGVIIASHDRALLEGMDRIVELSPVAVRIVGGGWSAFAAAREAERIRAAADLERGDAALRDVRHAVQHQREAKERRDGSGRAFAARGSEPKVLLGRQAERAENSGGRASHLAARRIDEATARAEAARARVETLTPLTIAVPPGGCPADAALLTLDGATVRIAHRILGPWNLALRGPERVAVAGRNGAGKTSLLRLAAGRIAPEGGRIARAEGRVAFLDQHVGLLDPADTIIGNLRRVHPVLSREDAHAACARFAFRNRDALRAVATLSGGERMRAGLACVLGGPVPPWLLVLDEPNNHLDIESLEVLEAALRAFDGGLLVSSHDAAFLDAIGIRRTVAIESLRG